MEHEMSHWSRGCGVSFESGHHHRKAGRWSAQAHNMFCGPGRDKEQVAFCAREMQGGGLPPEVYPSPRARSTPPPRNHD